MSIEEVVPEPNPQEENFVFEIDGEFDEDDESDFSGDYDEDDDVGLEAVGAIGAIAACLQTENGTLADVLEGINAGLARHNEISEGTNKILFRIAKLLERRA